ncbi:MAG: type II secretion system protein N [Betaproteobacteria bacterium]|jgi:general secretion pathway protein C
MRHFSIDRSNLAQTAVFALLTTAALIVLGFVAAYWTWVWIAPSPQPRAQAVAESGAGTSAGGLFGNVQRDRNSAAPTGIAIRLLGIVAAAAGRQGYAVVELEPRQILAVLEGEDVAPGIRLAEVATDHIILERGGTRETLAWPEKNKTVEPPVLRTTK